MSRDHSVDDPGGKAGGPVSGLSRDSLETVRDLLPISGAARDARDLVTDACIGWNLSHLIEPAALIASEFASNVVVHARTIMTVRVVVARPFLCLAFQDGSSAPPILRPPATGSAEGGRGLQIVESVSAMWGHHLDAGGKTVWAAIDMSYAGRWSGR
jgi:hypothetical protein